MVLVDYRAGSHELVEPLRAAGLTVTETTLPAGDIAFEGRGAKGASVLIGIEYKKLPDLIQSIRTERLQGHQLPEMKKAGYDHSWLLVEGELLYDRKGKLQRRTKWPKRELKPMVGGMTVGELLKRLFVLHLCGGLNPLWTQNRRETVTQIQCLYNTWNDCDLDQHKSHMGIYVAPTLIPLSPEASFLTGLPDVGPRVAKAAVAQFGSVGRALMARPEEWAELTTQDDKGKTRRLGMKTATKIDNFIHNRRTV